jgi:hypothetical protein
MEDEGRLLGRAVRNDVAAELSRRELIGRASSFGLGVLVLGALPYLERMARPDGALAAAMPAEGTMQAFFDTIIPGKRVGDLRTELGHDIHPRAIAGVDRQHGAVYTDALLLAHNPRIGFDALEPAFLVELESFAATKGGHFLELDYARREAVCLKGLAFSNPSRLVWEAAAAVPFTAFCAAANVRNANGRKGATHHRAAGYRVMGHPGIAPHGYRDFSYRKRLNRGRTKGGSLP